MTEASPRGLERRRGLDVGSLDLIVLLESALGVWNPFLVLPVSEQMRVPADHLLLEASVNRTGVQVALLLSDDDLEGEVEQEVAELGFERVDVTITDRIDDFVGLLEKVRYQGLCCLIAIPRTLHPEEAYERERPIE